MSELPESLRRAVHARAGGACEYCLLPESTGYYAHEVDHVVARKHDGKTELRNLALACMSCNRRKGSDLASIDPLTDEMSELFNPRAHRWLDHFQLSGALIQPRTVIGRTTARLLHFNEPHRVDERLPFVLSHGLKPAEDPLP